MYGTYFEQLLCCKQPLPLIQGLMKLANPGWMDSSFWTPILRFVPDIGTSDAGPLWRPFDRFATLAIHLTRGAVEHRQHQTQSYRRPGSDLLRADAWVVIPNPVEPTDGLA